MPWDTSYGRSLECCWSSCLQACTDIQHGTSTPHVSHGILPSARRRAPASSRCPTIFAWCQHLHSCNNGRHSDWDYLMTASVHTVGKMLVLIRLIIYTINIMISYSLISHDSSLGQSESAIHNRSLFHWHQRFCKASCEECISRQRLQSSRNSTACTSRMQPGHSWYCPTIFRERTLRPVKALRRSWRKPARLALSCLVTLTYT